MKALFEIPSFHDFIPPTLATELLSQAKPISGVEGLSEVGTGGGLEQSVEALDFLIKIYESTKHRYQTLLKQRTDDRAFIDQRTKACAVLNKSLGLNPRDKLYLTVLGLEDAKGRTVVGAQPTTVFYRKGGAPVAPIPRALQGYHVTLFGPPDSAKLAINAMNAYHRQLPGEPAIVGTLLRRNHDRYPIKWGADHEDSKTPIRKALVEAGENLAHCFFGDLSHHDQNSGKTYSILPEKTALPIKRITGLAMPCPFLFYKRQPIPLHLYELALHAFHHQARPEALTFYVPKLENEEEAAYFAAVLRTAEALLHKHNSAYQPGTIRVLVVLENARAVFRIHEIMDALYPYFAGASLGWHDYLASTARLFKEDGQYRIPSKTDPNIVINHIKESHRLLADVVGSRGGIKIGGMYGILPMDTDLKGPSFQVALRGFFKDAITQLKRDLTGFWVAHPDFARIGLALVEAWKLRADDDGVALNNFIEAMLLPTDALAIKQWVMAGDGTGDRCEMDRKDPNFPLALLAADGVKSSSLPNHDPQAVRYNVFQSLQYLADWLAGNGCVALPTTIDRQNVRVMDDLATAERSRWEVWHEVYHGRFKPEELIKIAFEELQFIRKNQESPTKKLQVRWDSRTQKWYPIALRLMLKMMTATKPPEFATELLLPFTVGLLRDSENPWQRAAELCPQLCQLDPPMERMLTAFEACGTRGFAREMADLAVYDPGQVEAIIGRFSKGEIGEAAFFHGDIGASQEELDEAATREQALAQKGDYSVKEELRHLGRAYQQKFGFKFLVSAEGRRADELLEILKARFLQTSDQEVVEARWALIAITQKRLGHLAQSQVLKDLQKFHQKSTVPGLAVAVTLGREVQTICLGEQIKGVSEVRRETRFQLASLSKTIATAFCLEFLSQHKIAGETSVEELLKKYKSPFRLRAPAANPLWADQVTLNHLFSHTALSMHYVKGYPLSEGLPPLTDLLPSVEIIHEPGTKFHYSGGGFLVLEHLVELISGHKAADLIQRFLGQFPHCDAATITFASPSRDQSQSQSGQEAVLGPLDAYGSLSGTTPLPRPFTQLCFPGFAAGARGTAKGMLEFLRHLASAYQNLSGSGGISHDTAVAMLHGRDLGSRDFMGCDMGLGVFVAEAGPNRFAVHQGANDGFRALALMGFRGPDQGKGLVILCNGDHDGVPLVADVACRLLRHLDIQGIDLSRLGVVFEGADSSRDLPAASRVNHAFKQRIFAAFEPELPETIGGRRILSPLADQNLVVGARVHQVSNQRFAGAENLLSPYEPVFDPELYGAQGKVMDSWESVRHNPSDRDFIEFSLNKKLLFHGRPLYARFSTAFHDGNHPDYARVLARSTSESPWVELVPKLPIEGHSLLAVKVDPQEVPLTGNYTWIRVEMFPDGGLSRFGLYQDLSPQQAAEFLPPDQARSQRIKNPIPQCHKPLAIPYKNLVGSYTGLKQDIDYASALAGAQVVRASNQHYGPADQLISPFEPVHMFDGLETKRSRVSGHFEEVEIKLGARIAVRRVVADFRFFLNNNPMFMSFLAWHQDHWEEFIPKTSVKGFAALQKAWILDNPPQTDRILVRIYPDGGVHRIHVYES